MTTTPLNIKRPKGTRTSLVQCKIVPEQAQEKFRESEHRLRLAIEAGGLGFFEHHISEHRILVSSNFCRIFALPFQPSISPAEWAERVHPDDRIQVLIGVQRMINTQSALDIEYRLLLPNKVVRWIHVMASPLVEDGKIVRSDGVVQDITQRKESESELRGLARAVGQSPVSVVITDLHGVIEYVNPKFCAVTGYSSEEVKGKNPRVLKSGEMPAETYRQLWATITAGQEWRGEFHNRKKNGDLYWEAATISAIRDDKGNITHFVAIKEDITERKRAAEILQQTEKELAESQRWQKAILDTAPDYIWMRDRNGRFLAANRTWCDFAGVKESEMLGKTIEEFPKIYPVELAKRLRAEDEAVMSSGRISQGELQLTGASLNTVWLESSKAPLLDEAGVRCGVVGIGRDITKRKQAEEELLESKLFLQSTLDALSAHIAILDEQGTVVAINAAWRQFARQNSFLGSNYGIGANYLALCESAVGECAAEASGVAKGIRTVMAGQCSEFLLEYSCHSPHEQRWFMVRVTRFGGGGPARVVVAHENITARKLAEEELQWKTAFLEAQVGSSIDGILVVDGAGRKILQNQRMTDLLKIPKHIAEDKDDEIQRRWVMQAAKNPEQFIEKVLFLSSHQDEISRDEMEMKDGTILDRYTAPMIGGDGKYYGRMWTFRDITKRKQAEAALKEQLALRERVAKVAANVPGIIYSFRLRPDGSMCLPYASPTIEEFCGARAEDLVEDASAIIDSIHPDDLALGNPSQNLPAPCYLGGLNSGSSTRRRACSGSKASHRPSEKRTAASSGTVL
jgi:PAS domain S-box-containing protein